MMNEQFIPYKLAVKLKELGFDEDYLGVWMKDGSLVIKGEQLDDDIKAPIWQQAFAWCLDRLKFIESYTILIDSDSYDLVIMDYRNNEIKESLIRNKTKEECLNKLVEICFTQKI